jgi:hypothetical protein
VTSLTKVGLQPASTATEPDERRRARSAPVRDPLWMLGRQWQTGELVATDGGSPVRVRIANVSAPVALSGDIVDAGLEARVEAEPPARLDTLTAARRSALSIELLRRAADAGISANDIRALRVALAQRFPLPAPGPSPASEGPLVSRRWPDGAAVAALAVAAVGPDGSGPGPVPALPGVGPGSALAAQLEPVLRSWVAWLGARYQVQDNGASTAASPPALAGGLTANPAHWDASRLQYDATLAALFPAAPLTLQLAGYDGLGLDWYSFDRDRPPSLTSRGPAAVDVRPVPVSYAGMPQPRYWALEHGEVNLDAELGEDPAHALLAQFAHAYSNDWFLVPLAVPPGACLVTALEVTDTFGDVTAVPSTVEVDGPSRRWRLWELAATADAAVQDGTGADDAAAVRVFLPPAAPPLEGPALEDVLVARDELANLAWLIELTTRDGDGRAVDRQRRWLALRPARDPAFDPGNRSAGRAYRLGTPLPDHWYPLVSAPGTDDLLLAELPPGAAEVGDDGVQGIVVAHTSQTRITAQEASRTGTRVTRLERLSYDASGRVLWRARARRPGTGEISSALRFDVLQ